MKNELTDEDFRMIAYFYFEKGDLARWLGWEEAKPLLEKQHPNLMRALQMQEMANREVARIIKEISGEDYDY